MNLFLDIVRRNERLINNYNTNDVSINDPAQVNNLHNTAQYVTIDPRSFDIVNNPFGVRRQSYGKIK